MNNKVFFKGALILIIFNLLGKLFGAIYRIPLAGILGGVGIGQYQLVFPLYSLILTVSTSGIPVAISKMVAEFNAKKNYTDSKNLLKISIVLLTILSLFGFLFIITFSKNIAYLQGNSDAYICYYAIAPAILFVGVISAFRGYFQGNLNMIPTALSNFIEQVFKMIFGLLLSKFLLKYGIIFAVFGALVGVSISEFTSFIFLLIYYVFHHKHRRLVYGKSTISYKNLSKKLIRLSIPITLSGLITPITSIVDSFLVVNLLMKSGISNVDSTCLLGLQSGVVDPLIHLPVVFAISISTVLLPNLTSLSVENAKDKISEIVKKSIQICLSISIAFIIGYVIFGRQILIFLYEKSFLNNELFLSTKLLFLSSFNIVFLSLVQVTSGILQGLGSAKYTMKTLLIGCVIKVVLEVILVSIKSINIFGVVISAGICFFIIFMLNYVKIKQIVSFNLKDIYSGVIVQETIVCIVAFTSNMIFQSYFSEFISMLFAGIITVAIFFVTYYIFFMAKKNKEIKINNYNKT